MRRMAVRIPVWFSRGAASARAELQRTLLDVSGRLAGLSEATERDFLAVGEKLQAIHHGIREETECLGGLLERSGSEREGCLAQALNEVAQWARQAGDAADCGELLAALAPVARAVTAPVAELQISLRALRVMGIMTRVESARLGSDAAGFEGLAIRADEMAGGIGRKAEDMLGAVGELGGLLDQSSRMVGEMSRLQQAELMRLTGECAAGFGELRREHARAGEFARSAGAARGEVAARIGELVVALQCHDSTRQRLEHIGAALETMAADPFVGGAAAVELQARQLREASQAFAGEFTRIASGLDDLASRAAALSMLARDFAGSDTCAGDGSPALAIEKRFAEAGAQMGRWIASRGSMAEAVGKVDQKCSEMSGFISEIEAVGAQMLWVALNAEIQAARLAASGAVMEAVAQGIRRVAQSACAAAAGAGEALRRLEAAAGALATTLHRDAAGDAGRAGDLAGHIERIVSGLATSGAEHRRLLASLASSGDRLAEETAALRQNMRADRVMAETSADCLASLEGIASRVRGLERSGGGQPPWLSLAQSRYAMHAEREVHASFTAKLAVSPPPSPSARKRAAEESELGANVELF
jgi:methyl-accepting chemotaxis protein